MKRFLILLTAVFPSSVSAQEVVLDQGFQKILVWKTERSREQGTKILDAGVKSPEVLLPLIACVPDAGSKAVIVGGERFSPAKSVVITSGDDAGCRGYVDAYYLPLDAR